MHDVTDQPIVLERKLRGLADCSQQTLPSGIPGAMAKGEKSRKVHGETRNSKKVEKENRTASATTVYFAPYDSLNTGLKVHVHT